MALRTSSNVAQRSRIRSTTVICVRRNGEVVMAADGQVTWVITQKAMAMTPSHTYC